MNQPSQNASSLTDYGHGPRAWLNDIEIGKITYLAAFPLLLLSLVVIGKPVLTVTAPYVGTVEFSLAQLGQMNRLRIAVYIFNVASCFFLAFPMIKFFEWRFKWILPVAVVSAIECVGVLLLSARKNTILENALLSLASGLFSVPLGDGATGQLLAGLASDLLSINIQLTAGAWLFFAIELLVLLCCVKMLMDIRHNDIQYSVSVI